MGDPDLRDIRFFLIFIRVNKVFFPIHQIGLIRMPRRYCSYNDELQRLNSLSNIRLGIIVFRVLVITTCIKDMYALVLNQTASYSIELTIGFSPLAHTFTEIPFVIPNSSNNRSYIVKIIEETHNTK